MDCQTKPGRSNNERSVNPFLRQLPYFNPYFETWNFQNLDEFARHDAEGKMYWGEVNEYDQSWRDYAQRNPNVDIKFFKFEEFLKNKVTGFQI